MSGRSNKGHNGTKKYGRAEEKCEKYRREHRREKNKIKKILRHIKRHPYDTFAPKHIKKLQEIIK